MGLVEDDAAVLHKQRVLEAFHELHARKGVVRRSSRQTLTKLRKLLSSVLQKIPPNGNLRHGAKLLGIGCVIPHRATRASSRDLASVCFLMCANVKCSVNGIRQSSNTSQESVGHVLDHGRIRGHVLEADGVADEFAEAAVHFVRHSLLFATCAFIFLP